MLNIFLFFLHIYLFWHFIMQSWTEKWGKELRKMTGLSSRPLPHTAFLGPLTQRHHFLWGSIKYVYKILKKKLALSSSQGGKKSNSYKLELLFHNKMLASLCLRSSNTKVASLFFILKNDLRAHITKPGSCVRLLGCLESSLRAFSLSMHFPWISKTCSFHIKNTLTSM